MRQRLLGWNVQVVGGAHQGAGCISGENGWVGGTRADTKKGGQGGSSAVVLGVRTNVDGGEEAGPGRSVGWEGHRLRDVPCLGLGLGLGLG